MGVGVWEGALAPKDPCVHALIWSEAKDVLAPTVSGEYPRRTITELWAKAASAAALRHTGPVRATAGEASFADTAEGTTGVHTPLTLAQQPALVQLSALINVHAAGTGGVQLKAPRTLAYRPAWPGHTAAAHTAALI